MTVETIASYGDLATSADLSSRDVDVVAELLLEHGAKDDWLIAWAPKWILEEKQDEHGIEPARNSRQILHGRVEHETEKAWLVAIGREEVWLPKSVVAVYELAPDADIRIPQRGLGEFEGEGEGVS